jgi:molybdenum cofactor cytidylyltransferase
MKIAAIVLAAGASRRLGQPKQLLAFRGKNLLNRSLQAAREAGCEPLLAVLGANAELIRPTIEDREARIVINGEWSEGMASSIRCGVQALTDETDAVILLACDQPQLDSAHLAALIAKWRDTHCDIIASKYGGTIGVPALFNRSMFPDLCALRGDQGARSLFQRADLKSECVAWPPGAFDVDTIEDATILRHLAKPSAND